MELTSPVPLFADSPGSEVGEEETRKSILKRFIDAYRSMPELWNTTLKEYSDRDKKKRGYETLRHIFFQLKPNATIEDVKKQINILRRNYRKELKKIKDSKRTGSASESVYEPSAWTFYELQFLADVEIPDKGRSSISKQNEATEDSQREDPIDIPNNRKKIKSTEKQEKDQKQLLSLACQYLSKEEEYPIATVWAKKLKSLDPQQAILTEKAINDILFETQLGTLTRNSVQINCSRPSSSISVFSKPASVSLPSSSPVDVYSKPTSAQSSSFASYNNDYRYVSTPMFSPPIATEVHNENEENLIQLQNVPLNNQQQALQVNEQLQLPADPTHRSIKNFFSTFQ